MGRNSRRRRRLVPPSPTHRSGPHTGLSIAVSHSLSLGLLSLNISRSHSLGSNGFGWVAREDGGKWKEKENERKIGDMRERKEGRKEEEKKKSSATLKQSFRMRKQSFRISSGNFASAKYYPYQVLPKNNNNNNEFFFTWSRFRIQISSFLFLSPLPFLSSFLLFFSFRPNRERG